MKIPFKFRLILVTIAITATGCIMPCDKVLHLGEMVTIPIHFVGFSNSEIEKIYVYRHTPSPVDPIDSFLLSSLLIGHTAGSSDVEITDNNLSRNGKQYGNYESYLHNCSLILDWGSGRDTLHDIEILKSKSKGDRCHKSNPNVRIDKISYRHKDRTILKNESIDIVK